MNVTNTIRLFVSSTFSDLKSERDALQREVFPRLKRLCLSKGMRFQAIDLRWGVSEEAGRDNKTMRICLRELRRCQSDHPKPNFLILLGDRYGWRPLPETILAALFEKLDIQLQSKQPEAAQLFRRWYRLDENAVPPVAELQPRRGDENWQGVEKPLLAALERAACDLGLNPQTEGAAIGASATEQEIIEGALKVADAAAHVRGFFRTIDNLPANPPPEAYTDVGEPHARLRLDALKDRIQRHLGNSAIRRYHVPWRAEGICAGDLKQFCDEVWKQLSEVVENQITTLANVPAAELEEQAHRAFGDERCRRLVGRREPLERVADYLLQGPDRPLAVIGPSGCGKSAVMAKAVQAACEMRSGAQIIARYVGATPASSDLIKLLRNVVGEIRRLYPSVEAALPLDLNELLGAFHEGLGRPSVVQPLWIFLDAIDQLTAGHQSQSLAWLPFQLPEHVRLVVSTALPDAQDRVADPSDPRAAIMTVLTERLDSRQMVVLPPLNAGDGEEMLANCLADAGRTLQERQRQAVIDAFQNEGSPLWLRTAAEEAGRLRSWDKAPAFADSTPGLLGQVLDRLSREEEHGPTLVSRTLSYLVCSRHGLAEDEMLDVLSADKDVISDFRRRSPDSPRADNLPVAVWVRLHGDLASYLAEREAQGARLIGFYHRSFLEAVSARGLAARYEACHRALARYFASKADPQGDGSWSGDYRSLAETVHHHVAGSLGDDVKRILCDLRFISASCRAGLTYNLAGDYEEAIAGLQGASDHERHADAPLAEYGRELLAYAEAHTRARAGSAVSEPTLPRPPLSAVAGARRSKEVQGLEPIPEFEQFVRSSTAVLDEHGAMPGFCEEYAYNSRNAGAVARAAEQILRAPAFSSPVLLRAAASRRPYEERPAVSRTLHAHSQVSSLWLAPDGNCIVSGGQDGTLRIWEVRTGVALKTVPLTSSYYHVDGLAVAADARIAVTSPDTSDKALRVWDLRDGVEIGIGPLEGHTGGINSIAMTPDGALLASGSSDKTVRIWDLANGKCVRVLDAGDDVSGVHISPNGVLATAVANKTAFVWEISTGRVVSRITFGSQYRRLAVSLDGRIAVLAGYRNVAVWHIEGDTIVQLVGPGSREYISAVAITPDGGIGAYAGGDRTVRVFDVRTRTELRSYRGHSQAVTALDIRADGQLVTSGGADGAILLLDTRCESTPPIAPELEGKVRTLAIDRPDKVALCQRESGKVRYYLLASGEDMTFQDTPGLAVGADARFCFSRSASTQIQGWDMQTGRKYTFVFDEVPQSADAKYPILSLGTLQVAAAAPRAISAGTDRIWVWDLKEGSCTSGLPVPVRLRAMSISSDGRFAAGAGGGNQRGGDFAVRVWDLEHGRLLHTLVQEESIEALAFTPDSQGLLAGGAEGILRLWHVESGRLVRTIGGKRSWIAGDKSLGQINAIIVAPDARNVVVVSPWTFRICDLREGTAGPELRYRTKHSELPPLVLITEDARYAVAGVGEKTLRVWDLASGRCLLASAEQAEILQLNMMADEIALVDTDGNALFGTLKNLPRGPAIMTAGTTLPRPCPMCGKDVATSDLVRRAIEQHEREALKGSSGCPCLDVAPDAWYDRRLDAGCDACGQAVRFNPFYASGSERA